MGALITGYGANSVTALLSRKRRIAVTAVTFYLNISGTDSTTISVQGGAGQSTLIRAVRVG